jgi:hypothetical protein
LTRRFRYLHFNNYLCFWSINVTVRTALIVNNRDPTVGWVFLAESGSVEVKAEMSSLEALKFLHLLRSGASWLEACKLYQTCPPSPTPLLHFIMNHLHVCACSCK